MPAWLNQWLYTPAIIIAILAVGTLVWKFGAWCSSVNHDRARLKRDADKIRSDWKEQSDRDRAAWKERSDRDRAAWKEQSDRDRAAWKEQLDEDRAVLQKFMKEIRLDIKNIFLRLPATPQLFESGSPLRLTEFGHAIANDLDAHGWAKDLAPDLLGMVEGMQPFEVDEFSEKHVESGLSQEFARRVAKCAFDFGIERSTVRRVLRVVLRDQLLARIEAGGTHSRQAI